MLNSNDLPMRSHANRRLLIGAALISMLLTLASLCTHNPINVDAILYLHAADIFAKNGLSASAAVFPWPWFSILVAATHHMTQLSLEHAAYLINACFQAIIAVTFVRLVHALGGSYRYQFAGAIVILCYPYINSIRSLITRDFGYWAFALLALLSLINYAKYLRWQDGVAWGIFMTIATLFRIEGAILLYFAPTALLLILSGKPLKRAQYSTIAHAIPIFCAVGVIALILIKPELLHHHRLGRIAELFQQLQSGMQTAIDSINSRTAILGESILDSESIENAKTLLMGGLVAILIAGFLKTISPLYALLSACAIVRKWLQAPSSSKAVIMTFIVINIIVLVGFLVERFFLAERYLVLLSFLLMLWVPFALIKLFDAFQDRSMPRWIFPAVCLAFAVATTGGIIRFGYSKAYITEAGRWIAKHTSTTTRLYSNSVQVLYYADRTNANWDIDPKKWSTSASLAPILTKGCQNYDYLAINITTRMNGMEKKIVTAVHRAPIQTFANSRDDKVLIFNCLQ